MIEKEANAGSLCNSLPARITEVKMPKINHATALDRGQLRRLLTSSQS